MAHLAVVVDGEEMDLRDRIAALEEELRRTSDAWVDSADRVSEFVLLHAAVRQIHAARGREELLQALQEIVINVLGSEELVIFTREGDELRLARAFGVPEEPVRVLRLGEGPIGATTAAGVFRVAAWDGPFVGDPKLTACVPLVAGGEVEGAIAFWTMLGHKPELLDPDREVMDMLSHHAGQAMRLLRLTGRIA
ncbi:MAG: GAF domain-containing protein [Anaeromyxobacteraceae bacterium]